MKLSDSTTASRKKARAWRRTALGVLGLCALLIALALAPSLLEARRDAQAMTAGTQLGAVGRALIAYRHDHFVWPEPGANVRDRLIGGSYLSGELIKMLSLPEGAGGPELIYCPPSTGTKAHDERRILLFENPRINPLGINVVYVDGHVEYVPGEAVAASLAGIEPAQSWTGGPFPMANSPPK